MTATTLTRDQPDARTDAATGLTDAEAAARRARGLGNSAPPSTGRTYWEIIRDNVFTFINISIVVLGIALTALGRPVDALLSAGAILVNAIVSIQQEVKAKRALDRIALLNRPTATVRREGQERAVAPEELVVGDIVRVGPGDQIVVDGQMVGGRVSVDESQLTGESDLVAKAAGDAIFSGSFCVSGVGSFEVDRVGKESFANQITARARASRRILTPLQRQVDLVIRILLVVAVYLEFILAIESVVLVVPLGEAVEQAALIAGFVPNGLLVSIAVSYAIAAVQVSRAGALVQQSNAIESLSNVDTLCMDKTGTLTANRLELAALVPLLAETEEALRRTVGAMVASMAAGNKTSEAIAAACPSPAERAVAEVPFSSARKWSAVALAEGPLHGVYALGAPEMLRPYLGADDAAWGRMEAQARPLTDQGYRVLLVAAATGAAQLEDNGDDSRLPAEMAALGYVSLRDELRPEARETLAAFRAAGVEPKVISGDNPETVAALAKQAGLGDDIARYSGPELAAMDETAFRAAATRGTIFGRITPDQKEHLVRALRAEGRYVAMIGDGVNDVLSLKQAQVGIAMQSGTQATRDVADLVLTNDSFAALVPAVREGQRVVNGMHTILKLFLARILTIALVFVSALWAYEYPLQLRQASLVALLVAGVPTTLLALWAKPGQVPAKALLPRLFHFVAPPVLIGGALGIVVFVVVLLRNSFLILESSEVVGSNVYNALYATTVLDARTALTAFLTITGILLIVFVAPPSRWWVGANPYSGDRRPLLLACALIAAFVAIVLIPFGRSFYSVSTLSPIDSGIVALAVALWLVLVRLAWRARLLERFLGVSFANDINRTDVPPSAGTIPGDASPAK